MPKGYANQPSRSTQQYVRGKDGRRLINIAYDEKKARKQAEFDAHFTTNQIIEKKPPRTDVDMDLDHEGDFDEAKYEELSDNYLDSLTDEEAQAVHDYVISGYQFVNEGLWRLGGSTEFTDTLNEAIWKYDGDTPKTLWRNLSGTDLPREFNDKEYEQGDIITFHGFTSTSETPGALGHLMSPLDFYFAENPMGETEQVEGKNKFHRKPPSSYEAPENVVFQINGSSAAPVSMSRGKSAEQEWLIGSGKEYRVDSVEKGVTITGGNQHDNVATATVYTLTEVQ